MGVSVPIESRLDGPEADMEMLAKAIAMLANVDGDETEDVGAESFANGRRTGYNPKRRI
jgi:hypothetical protein